MNKFEIKRSQELVDSKKEIRLLKEQLDTSKITRFEVIDSRIPYSRESEKGNRVIVEYGVSLDISLQDKGQTLKVFLKNRKK